MLHIDSTGEGPFAVILLHGAPTPVDLLEPLVAPPIERARRLTVHLPGYGRSSANPRGTGLEETVRRLHAAFAAAEVSDCALVGYSAGAYLALSLACAGRLKPRVVVTLAGFATLSEEERGQYTQFANVLRSGADLHALMPARLLSPGARTGRPDLAAEVERWLDAVPTDVLAEELECIARCEDLTQRLGSLACPVVCRTGEADLATPLHHAMRIMRSCPDARLEVVPGAGHALPLEDLEGTRASIARAIAAVWS